jgi:predicted metal-binding membrane protein
MWGRRHDQRMFTALLAALITLAWLALWGWGQSPYGRFLSHDALRQVERGDSALVLLFVAGWTLMVMAMMLPTSLPLITLFHTLTRRRSDQLRLVGLLIVGYLGVWTLFGMLVHLGDWLLHQALERSTWLEANAWALGSATLVLAGLYQFTPLKYYCLDRCRSPLSFIMEHWRGSREYVQSLQLGVHHGLFCLGCCWSLMLLMFAVGVGNLGWMLVLGTIMAIEKNLPWGRRLSMPLGIVLLGWGLSLALGAMPVLPAG